MTKLTNRKMQKTLILEETDIGLMENLFEAALRRRKLKKLLPEWGLLYKGLLNKLPRLQSVDERRWVCVSAQNEVDSEGIYDYLSLVRIPMMALTFLKRTCGGELMIMVPGQGRLEPDAELRRLALNVLGNAVGELGAKNAMELMKVQPSELRAYLKI